MLKHLCMGMAIAVGTMGGALADDTIIGFVKTADGEANLVVAGKIVKAQPGTPVQRKDVLKTGKPGSLGITLKDNTLLSIGPDTELVIEEFLYAPAKGDFKLGANVRKGSLNYVSGMVAKLKPDVVNVRTPTGTIGVRGTHFVVAVTED
ncbi:MAG: hypothetical protein D3M94_03655 [Rhodocyclales bacterium GT-UBC]|nr:MAG: hypothetical protein D3M94_03655 [Rhodocyclales bacterium GT-UBC]